MNSPARLPPFGGPLAAFRRGPFIPIAGLGSSHSGKGRQSTPHGLPPHTELRRAAGFLVAFDHRRKGGGSGARSI